MCGYVVVFGEGGGWVSVGAAQNDCHHQCENANVSGNTLNPRLFLDAYLLKKVHYPCQAVSRLLAYTVQPSRKYHYQPLASDVTLTRTYDRPISRGLTP